MNVATTAVNHDSNRPPTQSELSFHCQLPRLPLQIWDDLKADPERYGLFQELSEEWRGMKVASEESPPHPEISTAHRSESSQTGDRIQQTSPLWKSKNVGTTYVLAF